MGLKAVFTAPTFTAPTGSPWGLENAREFPAQCEQAAGGSFLPAEQEVVTKKDSLPKRDRAQSLEVSAQLASSRSSAAAAAH